MLSQPSKVIPVGHAPTTFFNTSLGGWPNVYSGTGWKAPSAGIEPAFSFPLQADTFEACADTRVKWCEKRESNPHVSNYAPIA